MWFKDTYQVRWLGDERYEVVKWNETHKSCFTIAFLRTDKDGDFELISVGMRLADYPEVLPWLKAFTDYQFAVKRLEKGDNW